MAHHKVYVVYDCKAESFSNPLVFRARGEALRMFQSAANDKQTAIGAHPADHTLFEVAEYDPHTGVFHPFDAKENLGIAMNYLNQ